MDLGEIKDEYRARVEPRGKSISEILEEAAKETKAYKQLEEENKSLNATNDYLQDEVIKWKHEHDKVHGKACRKAIENTDLRKRNKELLLYIKELEDELWVWKHSYRKLMKDKRLYEKARAVMFGPEEEDLYEDVK